MMTTPSPPLLPGTYYHHGASTLTNDPTVFIIEDHTTTTVNDHTTAVKDHTSTTSVDNDSNDDNTSTPIIVQ